MLNKATSTRGEVINDLERSLTAEQISELNELLKWVVYSNVSLTVDELEAAMALGSGIESVPWLESAIKTNYSAILKLEDDNVCVQDEVEEFLRKGAVALGLPDTVKDHSSISMTISIKSASREQCGHFFWALADRAFRNQFQFNFEGDSFNTFHALGQHISVDEFEANHFIVTRAFEYFRKDPVEETKAIDIYLLNWLPYHLDRLRVLEDDRKGELSSEQKSEIGLNLQNMFQDDRVLQNHKRTFQKGYWTSEEIKDVRLWLDDPAVVRRMDRKWRADVKTAPSPLRGYFKPIAIAVLEGLLRDRSWEVTNACTWLRQFIALDNAVTPQLDASVNDENDSTNSSPSSSAISDYSIYWNNTNSWCQGFLGLSDSQIDSLWYERLAEATLSEGCGWDVISSFYDRALEQEDPSWLCYRGLGVASLARGRTQDAVAQLGRALDEASKEAACPQPQPTDLAALHLLLGQCCHKTGGMRQAISHYSAAGEVGNSAQLMEGQLGQLRAALALEHAEKTVEVLESIFPTGHTAEKAFGVLKQIAEDLDHESLVLGVFDVAKNNPELLSRIKAAMRAATSNLSPVQDRTIDTIEEADYHIDDEVRGVLLYDQGIAAYQLANSSTTAPSEKAELVDNALMLWRESQEQLSHVGGTVFSSVRLSAISALAKHYFLNMVQKGPDMGQMETLAKMAKDDSMSYLSSNPCSGYLGVLHIQNGNKEKAREALKYQVETAIQILSDDWSENDHLGFYILQSTLSQYHDMENAVVARSLQGQPDLVTSALRFSAKDFPDVTEENKQRMMKLAIKLADETISQSRIHITVGSQQFLRIKAAKSYVESFTSSEYFEREIQSNDDQNSVKSAHCSVDDVEIVHSLIKKRLDALEDQHSSEAYDEDLITITCDGLAFDGKKCQKTADFETEFYQCTYCFRRDFCPDCLKNLRAIGSEASPVCSPTHKWLRCPPQGDDMYVGPEAEIVRVPTSVDVLPEDGQVWVAHYATEGVKTVLVDTWKEQLANHWGIPLSVGENAETETVTSEPVDIGDEGDGSNSGLT
ncbi:hypothetical protein CGMCC3_g14171 [Colletotrichum fructicola]|nr:uncharacterized protein CGMCC3_g14171 [Colletotrichum fructicola]KAE9569619.1 hypothetical protein CGMCC3_g14171 [Colletotrichum fructicola]